MGKKSAVHCSKLMAHCLKLSMKKNKKKEINESKSEKVFDPEVLRMYMMGATNPGFSNKIERAEDMIDLHLEKMPTGKGQVPGPDALFVQLDKFEAALDRAIGAGKLEFRVIHGFGKGKLKEEIYKILDKHPHVRSYENDYHSRYGYGSTLIQLK
jgi:Smr domain-containing protein